MVAVLANVFGALAAAGIAGWFSLRAARYVRHKEDPDLIVSLTRRLLECEEAIDGNHHG